jgi:hypothetical protein
MGLEDFLSRPNKKTKNKKIFSRNIPPPLYKYDEKY